MSADAVIALSLFSLFLGLLLIIAGTVGIYLVRGHEEELQLFRDDRQEDMERLVRDAEFDALIEREFGNLT